MADIYPSRWWADERPSRWHEHAATTPFYTAAEPVRIRTDWHELDRKVAEALGMAEALKGIVGNPPTELIARLNQGPGAHIRAHAYQYSLKIRAELARIERIRELQLRAVALLGTAIVALFVGIANFISNIIYGIVAATNAATGGF